MNAWIDQDVRDWEPAEAKPRKGFRSLLITPLLTATAGFAAGALWESGDPRWIIPLLLVFLLTAIGLNRPWDEDA